MGPVLVTGASGNVGREVVSALTAHGVPVRIGERKARAGSVRFDFADRSTFPAAVEGCRGVFLLRPPAISNVAETLLPLVDEPPADADRRADHPPRRLPPRQRGEGRSDPHQPRDFSLG